MTDPWVLGFVGVVLVVLLGAAFVPRRSRTLRERADRAAAKVGLALTDDIAPQVVRRQLRERRLSLVLSAITWVGAFAIVDVLQPPRFEVATIWFTNGSIVVGGAIGSAVAAMIDARRRLPADARRVARARSITFDDYVPRWEVLAARGAVVVAVAAVTLAVLSGTLPVLAGGLIAGLCIASLLLFEVAGRRIVRQRQQSSSTSELAWDDAIRSIDLKALELATFTTAFYALLGSLFGAAERSAPVHVLADIGIVALLVGAIVLGIVRAGRAPERDRYFLRRLWPGTAAQLTAVAPEAVPR